MYVYTVSILSGNIFILPFLFSYLNKQCKLQISNPSHFDYLYRFDEQSLDWHQTRCDQNTTFHFELGAYVSCLWPIDFNVEYYLCKNFLNKHSHENWTNTRVGNVYGLNLNVEIIPKWKNTWSVPLHVRSTKNKHALYNRSGK